jgi:hypothetical protein
VDPSHTSLRFGLQRYGRPCCPGSFRTVSLPLPAYVALHGTSTAHTARPPIQENQPRQLPSALSVRLPTQSHNATVLPQKETKS